MNTIWTGIIAWVILLGTTAWLYLFVKMLVRREWNDNYKTALKDNLNVASDE